MPCGGINCYADVPPGECFHCGRTGADHYCEEWDCMLHADCVMPFLYETDEGKIVRSHGHTVVIHFTAALNALEVGDDSYRR